MNWVVVKYLEKRSKLLDININTGKRIMLEPGTLQKLVARAAVRFEIEGQSDVPWQTIFSQMKAERLEVWHTGITSPNIPAPSGSIHTEFCYSVTVMKNFCSSRHFCYTVADISFTQ